MNVARFSRISRHCGMGATMPAAWQTSGQIASASASAGRSSRRFAAEIVTEATPALAKTHSALPPTSPQKPASPAGTCVLK